MQGVSYPEDGQDQQMLSSVIGGCNITDSIQSNMFSTDDSP